jgi:two-component system OmpR family sensor kinase
VGAVIARDGSVDAGMITADGGRSGVSDAASAQLAAIAPNRRPQTVVLDGLGRYRLIGLHARHGGQTIVTVCRPLSSTTRCCGCSACSAWSPRSR